MERVLTCVLILASSVLAGEHREHRVPYVHNIVLYPDKHSWCKTTEIKQIVAYPGCSSVEIDNSVCVGACFSYSIPKTVPSAPGEVIVPYCDSCQPTNVTWKEVTLICSSDSEENGGSVEMTKKVQVIHNCSCTSCNKQYESHKYHELHKKHEMQSDVPELMQLMMEAHNTRSRGKDGEEEDAKEAELGEKVSSIQQMAETAEKVTSHTNKDEKSVIPKLTEESEEEDEAEEAEIKENETETNEKIKVIENEEKILLEKKEDLEIQKMKTMQKLEEKLQMTFSPHHVRPGDHVIGNVKEHFVLGPHHSLVLKQEVELKPLKLHKTDKDDEEIPSLLGNQFKIHLQEDIPDQLAVETVQQESTTGEILKIPEMIYHRVNNSKIENKDGGDEKWNNGGGEIMVDIEHSHLKPAVEGAEVSYVVHDKTSDRK